LLILRIQSDVIINIHSLHAKYPLFLSDFKQLESAQDIFEKILKYQISLKSVKWEQSGSTWTDGRTDLSKPTVTFCNSVNMPKTWPLKPTLSQDECSPYPHTLLLLNPIYHYPSIYV